MVCISLLASRTSTDRRSNPLRVCVAIPSLTKSSVVVSPVCLCGALSICDSTCICVSEDASSISVTRNGQLLQAIRSPCQLRYLAFASVSYIPVGSNGGSHGVVDTGKGSQWSIWFTWLGGVPFVHFHCPSTKSHRPYLRFPSFPVIHRKLSMILITDSQLPFPVFGCPANYLPLIQEQGKHGEATCSGYHSPHLGWISLCCWR